MGNLIPEDVKVSLRSMTKSLTTYVESNDFKHILEIEDYLKDFFEAESAKFWYFNVNDETLTLLDNRSTDPILLASSLTQQVISTKESVLVNHITSNKYYEQSIDNPLDVKIKSLFIFPIIKANKVIGVMRILRGLKQRKSFIKKDQTTLETFLPFFLDVMAYKTVDKEKILQILNENSITNSTKQSAKKESIKKTTVSKKNEVHKDTLALAEIKEKLALLEKERSDEVKRLEEEIKTYISNEKIHTKNIKRVKTELEESMGKYEELERSSLEFYSESQDYPKQVSELTSHIELLNGENKALQKEIKDAKNNGSSQSISDLKSAKQLLAQQTSSNIDENIESILQQFDNDFKENEYAYMMFELIVYALYSNKGIAYIEEGIKKSKLVPYIIDGYYFKGDLNVYNEKCRICDLVKHIESYEKNMFSDSLKFKVTVDKKIPLSLVFDMIKVQSVILHLLMDLHNFVDHDKDVNINLISKKKFLNIEIGGTVHQSNSLFQSMFKQKNIGGDEKDRMGLQLSKKIVERLKGKIDYDYEDNYFKFMLAIPVQVIKL